MSAWTARIDTQLDAPPRSLALRWPDGQLGAGVAARAGSSARAPPAHRAARCQRVRFPDDLCDDFFAYPFDRYFG